MMKKFLLSILLFVPLVVSAQSVDEIVAANLKALGGADKLQAIQTLRITASISNPDGPISVTIQKKRPNLLRVDSIFHGQSAAQGFDGKTAWESSIVSDKPLAASPEDQKAIEQDAEFDSPLVDYKERGINIESLGKENVNGKPADKLKATLDNGEVEYLFLDAISHLEVKRTTKLIRQDKEEDADVFFDRYTQVNGVFLPFSIESRLASQATQTIQIKKVEINVSMDDSIFKMPAEQNQ